MKTYRYIITDKKTGITVVVSEEDFISGIASETDGNAILSHNEQDSRVDIVRVEVKSSIKDK